MEPANNGAGDSVMAKKRDRRSAPSSTRRDDQVESSTHRRDGRDDSASDRKVVIAFIFFFLVSVAISVLVYRFRYSAPIQSEESYVYQRGLVAVDANYQDILTVSCATAPFGH